VPERLVIDWTVGREQEVSFIRKWLEMESEGVMVLEGAYGNGKSHLLLYLREKAIDMGYAVAYAGFDPSEASAAFPKRTYRNVMRELRVKIGDRRLDFRGFLEQIAREAGDDLFENHAYIGPDLLADHAYLGPVVHKIRAGSMRERDWEWLEARSGVRGSLGSLYDFTTSANIYCNIFSGLGHAASTILDLKGFIILLDEAETTSSLFYSYQYARGLNFFKGLSMMANDDPILLTEETARSSGLTRGVETNLIYSGHHPVPYIYRISSFTKVVFSLTPGSLTDLFFHWRDSTPILPLEELKPEDLRKIFRRFVRFYCETYDFRLKARFQESDLLGLLEPYIHSSVRMFIKGMTELLDYVRFNPEASAEDVRSTVQWN
jgi:hypothetical protein